MDPEKEEQAYKEKYPPEPVLPTFCKHEPGTLGWFRYHTNDAPDDTLISVCGSGNPAEEIKSGSTNPKIGLMSRWEIVLRDGSMSQRNPDHRIRMQAGEYRVVAPQAQKPNKRGRVYINGVLIVEKRSKDSLGNEMWVECMKFDQHNAEALFTLLSNGGVMEMPF